MRKTALVLEGGGIRNVFTSGVLDAFMTRQIYFNDIFAISAGASAALSYMSGQIGRNKRVFCDYVDHPENKGWKYLIKQGEYINKEFLIHTVPDQLDPLDYEAFMASKMRLHVVVTNCHTGLAEIIEVPKDKAAMIQLISATISLPLLSKPVRYQGNTYLDGGVAKPLLFDEVVSRDYSEILFIMTQKFGYRKKPEKALPLIRVFLSKYPKIAERVKIRHLVYNQILQKIEAISDDDARLRVIRPDDTFNVTRLDNNTENIKAAYQSAYQMGMAYQHR